jgi:nucleotide-binding universal stress UspA family protein
MRRLLIGTDFSSGSAGALTRVPFLPLAAGAEILLLHVMPGWINPALYGVEVRRTEDRLRRAAGRLLRGLDAAGHDAVRVATMLAQGEPYAEILRRSARADLVVVGRHGRRTFRDLLLGSTAERVARHAAVPMLVVAHRARSSYRRPVAAVEVRDARTTLETVARLLEPGRRVLDVVHAYHPAHEAVLARAARPARRTAYVRECRAEIRRELTERIRRTSAVHVVRRIRLSRADPRKAILDFARDRRADLIAVGTHGRTGLAHAIMGSVAEAVMRHAACDVLVARRRR